VHSAGGVGWCRRGGGRRNGASTNSVTLEPEKQLLVYPHLTVLSNCDPPTKRESACRERHSWCIAVVSSAFLASRRAYRGRLPQLAETKIETLQDHAERRLVRTFARHICIPRGLSTQMCKYCTTSMYPRSQSSIWKRPGGQGNLYCTTSRTPATMHCSYVDLGRRAADAFAVTADALAVKCSSYGRYRNDEKNLG